MGRELIPVQPMWNRPYRDMSTQVDDHERRVRDLEKAKHGITVATFSKPGTISSFPFQPKTKWVAEHSYNIRQCRMSVGDGPSSSAVTGKVYKHPSGGGDLETIATLKIEIGQEDGTDVHTFTCQSAALNQGDYLTVEATSGTAGDAEDWSWQVRMLRSD
jgi:hypothetical protein